MTSDNETDPVLWDQRRSIPPEVLTVVGQVLFGDRWHGPLARALKVKPRDVRRWAYLGDAPAEIVGPLRRILTRDGNCLRAVLKSLDEHPGLKERFVNLFPVE